jgi:hypothetical protein
MDRIKSFFGLDEEVKMTADNDRIDLKTKGVDSLPRRLRNIFKRPPFSLIPRVGRDQPPPSMDPKDEAPVVGGKRCLSVTGLFPKKKIASLQILSAHRFSYR